MTPRFKRPTVSGETLACWRRRNEWLQTEAADLLGVSIRAYKSYEAGACPQVVWMAAQFYSLTHKRKDQTREQKMKDALAAAARTYSS